MPVCLHCCVVIKMKLPASLVKFYKTALLGFFRVFILLGDGFGLF